MSTADEKVKIVPKADLDTRVSEAKEVFERIKKKLGERKFDAVVVSGDITVANAEDGYVELKSFLTSLGSCLPDQKEAIVVVPGNHDVAWTTPPGSADRYKHFLRYVRDGLQATTPPLEGIDDAFLDGRGAPTVSHYWCNSEEGWAIIPLNSSNYCGSWASLSKISDIDYAAFVKQAATITNGPEILEQIDRLRLFDMARVSRQQLKAFGTLASQAETALNRAGATPLLIATLHHQLLPVSTGEEIKPFEGLTNLGQVRQAFADKKINLVLHGHKHTSTAYWDRQEAPREAGHDMLVLSGPTIGGVGYDKKNPCRIVEITPVPGGHEIEVTTTPEFLSRSRDPGFTTRFFQGARFVVPPAEAPTATLSARTFDEAYALLHALPLFLPDGPRAANNLIVHIAQAVSVTDKAPTGYPTKVVDDPRNLDQWFKQVAQWWQQELSELPSDLYFTHGMRICRYNGSQNQLNYVAKVLNGADQANGRAVICLVNPETDFYHGTTKRIAGWFPAFAMAQFYVTLDAQARRFLNIVGFFRKQEMRYWWAINVRELKHMVQEISTRAQFDGLGSITTIATVAIVGEAKPRVAVPLIDRWYDQDKKQIGNIVYAFVRACSAPGTVPDAGQQLKRWTEVLNDTKPPDPGSAGRTDSVPLATRGLELAATLLSCLAKYHQQTQIEALRTCLGTIHQRLDLLRTVLSSDASSEFPKAQYQNLWIEIDRAIEEARRLVQEVFTREP